MKATLSFQKTNSRIVQLSLLLTMLLCLLLPTGTKAQSTAEVGSGTSTNNYPMPGFYGWQYDVYLYTPSEASFLSNNCSISSLAWNASSANSSTGAQITVWVKDVDASYTLSSSTTFSTYTSGATQVYSSSSFTNTSGWNTLNFSSPFSHTAGKALLVMVRGVGCSTSGGCSRPCYYTTVSNTWWYKHADGSSDPGTSVSGTLSSSRANVKFTYTAGGGGGGSTSDCVEIGTGTSTSSFPMPGLWGWQYNVYLYSLFVHPVRGHLLEQRL